MDPALLDHVALTVRRALAEGDGDVLCFLPGAYELARVAGALAGLDVLQLHGRAAAEIQETALRPREGTEPRRVVLATSVAESSLTIPGVRAVVDAGLSREPRMDHARGLGALTTVRTSRATALQRAGRAGREAPGRVYRCWSQAEHDRLPERPRPEIELADLAAFALQAACWGDPDTTGLALLDPPPPAALSAARETLRAVGAVNEEGRATERGRRMARIGVHPRLARALLDGAEHVGERAAEVVALLSDDRRTSDDLVLEWRAKRRDGQWREEVRRLRRALPAPSRALPDAPGGDGVADARGGSAARPGTSRSDAETGRAGGSVAGSGASRTDGEAGRAGSRVARGGSAAGPGASRTGAEAVRGGGGAPVDDETVAGIVVAFAFPERVARARDGGYLMASGTAAVPVKGSRLGGAEWLAIAVADRPAGAPAARIRQAVPIDLEIARLAVTGATDDEVEWRDGDVVARRVERLGAIELGAVPLTDPDPDRVRAALREGLRKRRASACSPGHATPRRCARAWRSATARSARRGPR